jgi:hypothetical protein
MTGNAVRRRLSVLTSVVTVLSGLTLAGPPAARAAATPPPECPPTVHCTFVAAAYQRNDPADNTDWGNYDLANRPADGMAVDTIVIHDTEGSLQQTVAAFQDPTYHVSAHYVIDTDGTIVQMVRTRNIAWHAGNYSINMHSIGVEHVGHATNGIVEYTPAMYDASAKLVRWLARRFGVPLDRQHIIGHDNVPSADGTNVPPMHMDPGPFWNWQAYMWRLGAPVLPGLGTKLVTVAPIWPLNKQPVTGCFPDEPTQCVNTSREPTGIVYLRTAPGRSAPLLTDPVLGQGTTDIGNIAAKAYVGQRFAVAGYRYGTDGLRVQIWYGGQLGWLFSPWTAPTVFPAAGTYLTPRAGLASIAVYGRPYPEASAFPAGFTGAPAVVPRPDRIAAGQRYSVAAGSVPTDYYHTPTFNAPADYVVVRGTDEYVRIQFNGREAFVRTADAVLSD